MSDSEDEWKVLETYNSEAEARVVESFLTAQGFEVRLLDTYTMNRLLLPTGGPAAAGLRLMVRASDFAGARESLDANSRASHLEIVGTEQPVVRSPWERWAFVALIALIILVLFLTHTF